MNNSIFSNDCKTSKELKITEGSPIADVVRTIVAGETENGKVFANEITDCFISDFEKLGDKMAHVSTFIVVEGTVYMTYYANTKEPSEDPKNQTARLVYAPVDDVDNKTFIDFQTTGDTVSDKVIDMVYDTILMQN